MPCRAVAQKPRLMALAIAPYSSGSDWVDAHEQILVAQYPLTIFDVFATVGDMKDVIQRRRKLATRAESCCADVVMATDPRPEMPQADVLAERLKALADPTRLRMLDLLARRDTPLCVCEITDRFPLHQPTISHHLRILRQAGLISGEKRGVWSYYAATEAGQRSLALAKSLV